MAVEERAGAAVDSAESWVELTEWLPEMLEELLASEVYGIDHRPPRGQRGIYLFSENDEHLYVGRTSVTARSRARGGVPITSFRHRFDQHIQLGRPPRASSFANRLMLERAAALGLEVPTKWWVNRTTTTAEIYDMYKEEKLRIGAMDCRIVTFEDDVNGVRSSVAEMYAHVHLGTSYNDFSTS
jgi:hypothetical protein